MPKTLKGSPLLGSYHYLRVDLLACATKFTMHDGRIVGGEGSDCELDLQKIVDAIPGNQLRTQVFMNSPYYDSN